MTALPPTRFSVRSARRIASGRSGGALALGVGLATALGACGAPIAPTTSPGASPGPATPSLATVAGPGIAGLLIAASGPLLVSDEDGHLDELRGVEGPMIAVSAARGTIAVVGSTGTIRVSGPAAPAVRTWRELPLPAGVRPDPRLLAVSPDGATLAFATGELQGEAFSLELVDLASAASRSIPVRGGLDGAPIWIGNATVAVRTVRPGQAARFTQLDIASGDRTDIVASGVALAATADGRRVAFDDARTGEVLVGERTDWSDAGLARMTRLANPSGGGVDGLTLSADGTRLAITRRTDAGVTIEVLVETDGAWRTIGSISIPGARTASVAWLD